MANRVDRKSEAVKHFIVVFVLMCAFFPLFVSVVVSFKSNEQYQTNPWFFDAVSTWRWGNWARAWGIVSTYIANSVIVTVMAVTIGIAMIIPTSYVLARYRFPGRSFVYYGIVASMFLPGTAATLVTLYWLIHNLGMVNTLSALIVVGAVGGQVTGIFIMRQFIEDIPRELFESAQVDGAGHLQQIGHIVIPMSAPIMGTVTIMNFLGVWNMVMLPLILLRDEEKLTIPVGLLRLEGEYVKQWGEMMAGYLIASVPLVVLFLFTMRWFVRGLSAGAIKG